MRMNREETFSRIKEILQETLKWRADVSQVDEQTHLVNELGLSSLEGLEILVKIETEFDFEIDDEDLSLELMSTLSSLIDYVDRKKQA